MNNETAFDSVVSAYCHELVLFQRSPGLCGGRRPQRKMSSRRFLLSASALRPKIM
jgi:hypothetical protein